ncbi:MAG TPA: TolC family protein, partial [Planctomycetaceae bacterium]
LRPFQLISPELSELELRVDDDYFAVAATLSPDDPDPAGLRRAIETLIPILDEIESVAFPQVEQDLARVRENLPKRLAAAPDPVNDPPRIREYLERDEEQLTEIRNGYVEQVVRVEQLLAAVAAATTPTELQALYVEAGETEEEIERIVRGLQGIQVGLRTELIELNPFEMPLTEAVGYALTNRVDLMNQRALVTDARRKVEVAANALRAVLDLRVEEELSTRPIFNNDNPLDFRRDQSTFRAGVRFVAPLDQIAQRNAYRVSQINYQRVRRSYMQAEDQVKFQVRQAWRDLEVLKRNFEVARNAIRINAQQYDLAVERATGPARGFGGGGGGGAGGGGGGGSSGADQQGLNLINALQRLLQSQNQLIAIWVDYESARLNIYRDMGIMEIDARGVWCDPFYLNGLSLPDGDVQGPPGWVNPAEGTDGPAERNGGPAVIPPAPSPPGGVETEGGGPSGSAPASNPASRPVSRGVLPASHTAPPSPPSRKAGHDRTRQPPVPNRRERPSDRDRAGAAKPEPTRWRSAGQGPGKG